MDDLFGCTATASSRVPASHVTGMMNPGDRIFSVKEIAAMIGFHPMTVYQWIDRRGLPIRRSTRSGRISIVWREFQEWWARSKD